MKVAVNRVQGLELASTALGYKDALWAIDQLKVAILVCDHDLGSHEGHGLDLCHYFKARHSRGRTVLVTGHGEKEVLKMALSEGLDGYVEKPCLLEELIYGLRRQERDLRRDIIERETLEEYRLFLQALPDIVYKIDAKGNIVFINSAVRRLGYEPDELIGEHIRVLIHPDDYARCNSKDVLHYYRNQATGDDNAPKLIDERRAGERMTRNLHLRVLSKDYHLGDADGLYSAMVNAFGQVSSSGVHEASSFKHDGVFDGTVGIIRDISERVRFERALLDAKVDAEQANRTKGQILANVSHETRTPLNTMLGHIELLSQSRLGREEEAAFQQIRRSGERLTEMLDDVVTLSQMDSGQKSFRPCQLRLKEVIDPIETYFHSLAGEKNVEFTVQVDDPERSVFGDGRLLSQSISKLLSNAFKFTDQGSVELSIAIEGDSDADLWLRARVKDTGSGIPDHLLTTIFEAFRQADGSATRMHGGMGIGLTLCRDWVELMGGRLKAESKVGQGSLFSMKIPVSPPSTSSGEGVEVSFAALNIVMLLVHEDEGIATSIARRWKHFGIRMDVVHRPGAALKSFMIKDCAGVIISRTLALENQGALQKELAKFMVKGSSCPSFSFHRKTKTDNDRSALAEVGIEDTLIEDFGTSDLSAFIEKWRTVLESHQEGEGYLLEEFGLL